MSSQPQAKESLDSSTNAQLLTPPSPLTSNPEASSSRTNGEPEVLPRSKRNSCVFCKKRKLRCDGGTPSCGTCTRLKHECTYGDVRRKSGPKKGYVKGLEDRLAELEKLLARQDLSDDAAPDASAVYPNESSNSTHSQNAEAHLNYGLGGVSTSNAFSIPDISPSQPQLHSLSYTIEDEMNSLPLDEGFPWAIIELGLDEPLPAQSTIDALNNIYFAKVHPSGPFIHQYRFLASMSLSPYHRPPASLRYAMWTLAASTSEEFKSAHTHFYAQARKYAEADEMAGRYKYMNVWHVQAWLLISLYEFKMLRFPQAFLSGSRATRQAQVMGLHRLDGLGLEVKPTIPRPMDWIEKEERRRTFWMAFCMDRYGSSGTGWPMAIDESDILTNLPSSEEAFDLNEEAPGISLSDAMLPENASKLSAFAGAVVVASVSGRTLIHLHRPSPTEDGGNINGEFWRLHRKMDNILLNTSLCLPAHLRLPAGTSNSNTIFLNMSLQTATICLHQAALFKAEKFGVIAEIMEESKMRCITAATEIAAIMKMVAHLDLTTLNVYTPFSVYVATRIFSHVIKTQPENDFARSTLRFLVSALIAMKDINPTAQSHLIHLDLEGGGLSALQENVRLPPSLEKSMADASIDDKASDPIISFASPLVRIVDQTEESLSVAAGTTSSADDDSAPWVSSAGPSTGSLNHATLSSSSDGYATGYSGEIYLEKQSFVPQMPQAMDDLTLPHVDLGPVNMQDDVFESLMDMETQQLRWQ